jgi:hypothetical protein
MCAVTVVPILRGRWPQPSDSEREAYPCSMASRLAGALAVVGGAAWLVKVALIWQNGGTNTTDGLVGVLFNVGAVAILLALTIRAWLASAPQVGYRLLSVLAVTLAFVAAVNVPIALGWVLFGRTWLAEELGIILTAVVAVVLGARWVTHGRGEGLGQERGAA